MKFAVSYSCGKDSTLAFHKMVEAGHEPVCLIVMVNDAEDRSYFHGADPSMLEQYADALGLPMIECRSTGEDYAEAFEAGLAQAKEMGAEGVCFGDIDIEANRQWEVDRCEAVGLEPCLPLWQAGREACVQELIDAGYTCLIKSINRTLLPMELLGQTINACTVARMKEAGIDVCGENGEYHTLALDGPLFQHPLDFEVGEPLVFGDYAVIEVY